MRRLLPWLLTAGLVVMILAALAEVAQRQSDEDAEPTPRALAPTVRPSPSPVTTSAPRTLVPGATTPLGSPPVGPATPPLGGAQATRSPAPTTAPVTPRPPTPAPATFPPVAAAPTPAPATGGAAAGRTAETGGGALAGGLWTLGAAAALRRLARSRR